MSRLRQKISVAAASGKVFHLWKKTVWRRWWNPFQVVAALLLVWMILYVASDTTNNIHTNDSNPLLLLAGNDTALSAAFLHRSNNVVGNQRNAVAVPKSVLNNNNNHQLKYKIPHILIFTGKDNLLTEPFKDRQPRLYQNTMRTIELYRTKAWNEPNAEVWFLDNQACVEAIQQVEPRLVPHFREEPRGDFKSDICRLAALYLKGGYYMDTDMEVIEPLVLSVNDSVSFVTAETGPNNFFQAILWAAPRHPIIVEAIHITLHYYDNVQKGEISRYPQKGFKVGPFLLPQAYAQVLSRRRQQQQQQRQQEPFTIRDTDDEYLILKEGPVPPEFHGLLTKRPGKLCNFIVYSSSSSSSSGSSAGHGSLPPKPYFYSRFGNHSKCRKQVAVATARKLKLNIKNQQT